MKKMLDAAGVFKWQECRIINRSAVLDIYISSVRLQPKNKPETRDKL